MRRFLLALCLLLAPAPALAWGRLGHRLIARLAEDYLGSDARKEIQRLLGGTAADVSTWADSIRGRRPETAPWHYINVPTSGRIEDWIRYCPPEGCILRAIDRSSAILRDRAQPDSARAEALRFIIHFVGDLHMPLHVGERGDRGGNDVPVTWQGRATNLHSVWDSYLIASPNLPEDDWLGRIRNTAKALDRNAVAAGSPVDWAAESHALARDSVYALPAPPELSGEYAAQNLPRAEERLARAGIRLGFLLNRLLGP